MNLKKMLICLAFLLSVLSLGVYAKTVELTIGSSEVNVKEASGISASSLLTAPYAENGRTFVPVRFISEKFGADVNWVPQSGEVVIKREGKDITLTIGSEKAVVDGKEYTLDAVPVVQNDTTMVPVRFVSEAMGYTVSYVPITNQVLITDNPAVASVDGADISYDIYEFVYNAYKDVYGEYETNDVIAQNALDQIEYIYAMKSIADQSGFVMNEEDYGILKASIEEEYDAEATGTLKGVYAEYYTMVQIKDILQSYIAQIAAPESEEEVEQYYKDNYAFVKHILINGDDAERIAKKVKSKITAGGNFDKLMEEYSADNNRDGFGFTYGDTVEEFEKAAFELGENKVSGVVKTIYGYHIIKRLPLPEMDPEISYNVYVAMAYKAANEYLDTVVENCEITENFYIEELIEMLETE